MAVISYDEVVTLRFPRIKDTVAQYDRAGQLLCRNCDAGIGSGRRFYCSRYCMDEFFFNNSWYHIRRSILRRDKFCCSICRKRKRKAELDVDHIIPVRLGVNVFDKKNLRTLCKECHKAKTRLDREALGF